MKYIKVSTICFVFAILGVWFSGLALLSPEIEEPDSVSKRDSGRTGQASSDSTSIPAKSVSLKLDTPELNPKRVIANLAVPIDGPNSPITLSAQEEAVRASVERVLSESTHKTTANGSTASLRRVVVDKHRVTLDFSEEIARLGLAEFEATYGLILNAIHPIIQGNGIDPIYPEIQVRVLVEGAPVEKAF